MSRWMIIFALPLAACQGPDTSSGNEAAVELQDTGVPADSDAVVTDANAEDVARAQEQSDREMAQPMGKAFPASFQGRWGLNANDCTSTRGDAKGLLTITDDRLRFYESVGTVKEMTIETPLRLTADLQFEGEGETWSRTTEYAVSDDGRVLIRSEIDPATSYRYQRCG